MDVKGAEVGNNFDKEFIRKREEVWRRHRGGTVLRRLKLRLTIMNGRAFSSFRAPGRSAGVGPCRYSPSEVTAGGEPAKWLFIL